MYNTDMNKHAELQVQQTVDQEAQMQTIRMATVTCECGQDRALVKMYKCLYCDMWMCIPCAEIHFGKTIQQYREEKKNVTSTTD